MPAVELTGPAGRLEALLEEAPDPRFAAVVCHPHPRFGGTMHTHAAYHLARAVRAAGGIALRFNYRGVGRSAGRYDGGRGEVADTRAALDWLAAERPGLPLLAIGFSFGAWMVIACAGADPRVAGLLLAGLALRSADPELERHAGDVRAVEKPVAVVQAARDEFGLPEEVRHVLAGSTWPRRLAVVPGATHLFTQDLPTFQREAEAAIAWLLAQAPEPR